MADEQKKTETGRNMTKLDWFLLLLFSLPSLAFLWAAVCYVWQFGWLGAIPLLMALMIISWVLRAVGGTRDFLLKLPTGMLAQLLLVAVCALGLLILGWLWIKVFKSYNFDRDVLAIVIGLGLGGWVTMRLKLGGDAGRLRAQIRMAAGMGIFIGVLTTWLLASALDGFFPRHALVLKPERFADICRISRERWKDLNIGVALSGGGYRAALLHAGVLTALERQGVRVTSLSSVSGGSIIGAFYALGGEPTNFLEAVKRGDFNIKRDLADFQNLIRLPFPAQMPSVPLPGSASLPPVRLLPGYEFSRTDVQASLLDRVFLQGRTLQDAPPDGLPSFLFCTTDLRQGVQVGFTAEGILLLGPNTKHYETYERSEFPVHERLANLVAASGAFPGAFAPQKYELKCHPDSPSFSSSSDPLSLALADGGIIDNLGLKLLSAANSLGQMPKVWRQDLIFVSNGGLLLQAAEGTSAVASLNRAIELSSSVNAAIEEANAGSLYFTQPKNMPPVFWLSPGLATEAPDERIGGLNLNIAKQGTKRRVAKPNWNLAMHFEDIASEVKQQLIALHPEKAKAAQMYAAYTNALLHPKPPSGGWSNLNDSRETAEGIALGNFIIDDIGHCLDVFQAMPTLEDNPKPADADSVFRLGLYLVLQGWDKIEAALNAAVKTRQQAEEAKKNPEARKKPFFIFQRPDMDGTNHPTMDDYLKLFEETRSAAQTNPTTAQPSPADNHK